MQVSPTTIDLPVLGMTCAACVGRVERAAAAVPGVTRADVNLVSSLARISATADAPPELRDAVVRAIRDAGYEVPADALDAPPGAGRLAAIDRAAAGETRGLSRDATIAIALAIALMIVAMGLPASRGSVGAQLALGTLSLFGPGRRYLRGGWSAVRHGSPDMSTLIAIGAGVAWLASAIGAVRWLADGGEVPALYFDAGAAIVAFVMLGKLLEARARARLGDAVRGLVSLAPAIAHRIDDDVPTLGDAPPDLDVPASGLAPGDRIVVRPGERFPADGTAIAGTSSVDESLLTGESMPVDKAEGSPVYAGTLNQLGVLVVRVARAGTDTSLARIARAVEDAQGNKAPIARLADRVARYFVPAVLAIGALTFAGWLVAGAASDEALSRAIAVLVIACPCALGLATPAAVAVGTSRAAELGVLFHGGAALETASSIAIVCLDKTGTLTTGKPALVEVIPTRGFSAAALLRLAASAEQGSEHPIARAIVDGVPIRSANEPARGAALADATRGVDGALLAVATDVQVAPGGGVTALVDGRRVVVGSRDHVALAAADPRPLDDRATALAAAGRTIAYVAVDGSLAGLLAVADPAAPGAVATIAAVRALGIDPIMITGDREGAARWIASEVGITNVRAGVRPTEKAAIVADLEHVAMVGDGLNDAPALAAADLGIALGTGTDIAAAAADVTLLRGGIAALPTVFAIARATMRTIRRNLVAAFAYNVVCIPLAAAGVASPMIAAAAMSLSSVSVLLSSLRLRAFVPATIG